MMNRNAHEGTKGEQIVALEIKNNSKAARAIVQALTGEIPDGNLQAKAEIVGHLGGKTDVLIETSSGHKFKVSVKSYRGTGFNQVTRLSIDAFAKQFSLPGRITTLLKELTLKKAGSPNRRHPWISKNHVSRIIAGFKPKALAIIQFSLLGHDCPELLVLHNWNRREIRIYNMTEVLEQLKQLIDIKVTPQGVLKLNEYFSIQKKGGNGKYIGYPKNDLRHGGNNIQVKMKTEKISALATSISTLIY